MGDYAVTFSRSARRELENLDAVIIRRIIPKIESLSLQPRPAGCRKLVGEESLWRIRVGDYRVIYSVDDKKEAVDVIGVRHRSKAYD